MVDQNILIFQDIRNIRRSHTTAINLVITAMRKPGKQRNKVRY